ncbi:MAG: 23S rRNA (adenine(2030)-N(6))-methyltransferase RlmJ [Burkholderiales bacterium]
MLAYRHLFHAGNFADVFKHAMLAQLVLHLGRKDKPFLYLDTHAGIGRYDLKHDWAQKNAEFREGIVRVWGRADAPESVRPYLDAVTEENPDRRLRFYPGSPRLVRRLIRPGDRMLLTELNKADCAQLAEVFARDRQVHVQLMDGYQALKAHLPPRERRGLIFMDSSFDRANEFKRIVDALKQAHVRFATGVYAVWYPLMEPAATHRFERDVAESGIRRILRAGLSVQPDSWQGGLRGSAMLIVNPPFEFDLTVKPMVEWLWKVLSADGEGGFGVEWLVPE